MLRRRLSSLAIPVKAEQVQRVGHGDQQGVVALLQHDGLEAAGWRLTSRRTSSALSGKVRRLTKGTRSWRASTWAKASSVMRLA